MTRGEILKIAKPILFNTDMTRAILEERKTATRRKVDFLKGKKPNWTGYIRDGLMLYNGKNEPCIKPPRYKVGDYLYVRETWGICNFDYDEHKVYVSYKAGDETKNCHGVNLPEDKFQKLYDNYSESEPDWRPSIHMPKEAARIFLRITDVKVKRLQDMWASDIPKEGILFTKPHTADEMIASFAKLWNSTIPKKDLDKYGWSANPWVWVIEFERVIPDG